MKSCLNKATTFGKLIIENERFLSSAINLGKRGFNGDFKWYFYCILTVF